MAKHVYYMVWFRVDEGTEDEWNQWMDKVHIPDILAAEGFISARKFCVQRDSAGLSFNYVTMYEIESLEAFERYNTSDYAERMREEHSSRYAHFVMAARTVLEEH